MASAAIRVEKATSDLLIGPDWTMNMDICDSINTYHWQAKDVVKAVKKRLQNKNPMVQLLALTLLETMIKNCGDYVHFQVVERNILQEMIKIVKKKTDMNVRDKILVLLDSWQRAFGGPGGKYPQYFWAYDELRRSGVEFPQRAEDAAPIFTPPVTHPGPGHSQAGYGMPSNISRRLDEAMASEMENLSLSSLDSIRSVMELLNDMLYALNPNDREAVKDEVIVDLVDQCRSNQRKLMQVVNSTVDEELLGQGLALNDDLQSILAKHDAIASGSPLPTQVVNSSPKTDVTTLPLAAASDPAEDEEEEDDDFAQLARRRSQTRHVPSQSTSTETNDHAVSLNSVDATTMSTATAAPSTSILSGPLALPESPNPVRTTKEQDMIDLLSITLSTNSSSPTPLSASSQTRNQVPLSPNDQGYPYVQHSCTIKQGQVPHNSYVVPWAQPQTSYQPQPQPSYRPRSQPQPNYQPQPHPQPQPQPNIQPQPQSQLPQSPIQLSSSYPPPPWAVPANSNRASPGSTGPYPLPTSLASTTASYTPVQPARPFQQYHSFGSRGNNATTLFAEPHTGTESRQAVTVKPFVPSNRLFEDLVDLRNTDGGLRTGGGSSNLLRTGATGQGMMGQGMMSGRK